MKNKRNWEKYQKFIPENEFYYLRSCIRQNFFPASEEFFFENFERKFAKRNF